MWRFNNMLQLNQLVKKEIKEEIIKYMETNENENTAPKVFGPSKNSLAF